MKVLPSKNYSCKRLFHGKVKPHTSRQTSKCISNLKPTSLTQRKKQQQQKNKTSKTNKQTLNNKDPNKTRNYFDIKISIIISRCILLSLS